MKKSRHEFYLKYVDLKNQIGNEVVKYIIDELNKRGLITKYNKDYDFTVNGIPMHAVSDFQAVTFNNNEIWGNKDFKTITRPTASSYGSKNPEIFEILKDNGVDSAIGGPSFTNIDEIVSFFNESGLNIVTKRKLNNANKKTGVFEHVVSFQQFESYGIKTRANLPEKHNPDCFILVGDYDRNTDVTYCVYVRGEKIGQESCEIYMGPNYKSGATCPNRSYHYTVDKIPKRWISYWQELKKIAQRDYPQYLNFLSSDKLINVHKQTGIFN